MGITSNDMLESDFVVHDINHSPTFRYCLILLHNPDSRCHHRKNNHMLVWISCFSEPWLHHQMILLVFNSVCALCGVPANLFSDLFSGPSCSQFSNPAVQSLIQPFVHIFCWLRPTKDVHQNMSVESGRFFNSKESVFLFIAFNYLQIGMWSREYYSHLSFLAHLCSKPHRWTVIRSFKCMMYKLDLPQNHKCTFRHAIWAQSIHFMA